MEALTFGELIRRHRVDSGMSLKDLAAGLQVDTSLMSKWERGEREPSREQVLSIAKALHTGSEPLLLAWLRDKLLYKINDEDLAIDALKAAEEQLAYQKTTVLPATRIKRLLAKVLAQDPRVKAAWLFGSYARGEAHGGSDIDVMVEFDPDHKTSYLHILDLAHELEQVVGRKVDIVERRSLISAALHSAEKDMIKIHG